MLPLVQRRLGLDPASASAPSSPPLVASRASSSTQHRSMLLRGSALTVSGSSGSSERTGGPGWPLHAARRSGNLKAMRSVRLGVVSPWWHRGPSGAPPWAPPAAEAATTGRGRPMPELQFARLDGRGDIRLGRAQRQSRAARHRASWWSPARRRCPCSTRWRSPAPPRRGDHRVSVDEDRAARGFAGTRPRWTLTSPTTAVVRVRICSNRQDADVVRDRRRRSRSRDQLRLRPRRRPADRGAPAPARRGRR